MKKSLFSLALIASSLLAVQAATVQIDFGRSDATTEGALNMNYDNASASLGSMPGSVSLAWSTAGGYVSENGYTTPRRLRKKQIGKILSTAACLSVWGTPFVTVF